MRELDKLLNHYDLRTLEGALARRRARDKSLKALAAKRRKLEGELAKLAALTGGPPSRGRSGRRALVTPKPNARRLNTITLAEAIEKVLKARKGPTHYKDLMQTIAKRGIYKTKSKNLLSTVAVTLKRDGRFRKVKPGVYALR